jgi:hypothetical protein
MLARRRSLWFTEAKVTHRGLREADVVVIRKFDAGGGGIDKRGRVNGVA